MTAGGAPIEVIRSYIESQGEGTRKDRPILSIQQEMQQMRKGKRNTGIIRADLSLQLWKSYGQGCERGDQHPGRRKAIIMCIIAQKKMPVSGR